MIQKKTLSYIDWNDLTDLVQKKSGRDIRNWADKSYDSGHPNYLKPYQDYWHKLLHVYEVNFYNGCHKLVSFRDIWKCYRDKEWSNIEQAYAKRDDVDLSKEWIWIKEISDLFEQVLDESGITPDDPDDHAYNIHFWW